MFQWENSSSAQRPEMPESEPSMSPALDQPCRDSWPQWMLPMKEQALGVCQTCLGPFLGSAPLLAFHSN